VKVTARTSTALVVRDSAGVIRLMGAFCFLFGLLFVGIAAQGATTPLEHVVPAVIGVILAVCGVLAMVLPATRTFIFDKARRHLFITRRSAFRRPVEEAVELKDIAGIDLERTGDGEGDAMFRVALVLTGGARRPWTNYYRSGGAQMRAVVDIVRGFLQLEPPATPNTAVRLSLALGPAERRASTWFLAIGLAICVVFLAIGGRLLWLQESRLVRYVPVDVVVDSARMAVLTDDEGDRTYRPVVSYHYEVGGERHVGQRVTPLDISGASAWAREAIDRYAVGGTYTGYIDPEQPSESFLSRERAAFPYLFAIVPVFGLLVLGVSLFRLRASPS
jgi:hypothetical protein